MAAAWLVFFASHRMRKMAGMVDIVAAGNLLVRNQQQARAKLVPSSLKPRLKCRNPSNGAGSQSHFE